MKQHTQNKSNFSTPFRFHGILMIWVGLSKTTALPPPGKFPVFGQLALTNLPGDLANPGRQLINSSEELINETDPLINLRHQLTNSSAKLINSSGELINGNDSLINLGDQLTNSSKELINWRKELVNVSEELINLRAESLDPSTLSLAEWRLPAGPGDFLGEDRTNLRARVKNLDRRWNKCPTQTAKEVGMGNPTEETIRAGQQNSYARPEPPPSRKFNPARGL